MTHLNFHIEYFTNWGQQIYICGSVPELGSMDECKALLLRNISDKNWEIPVSVQSAEISYFFLLKEGDRVVRKEWGSPKSLQLEDGKSYEIFEQWKDEPYRSFLYSSLFTESLFYHLEDKITPKGDILIKIRCPYVERRQSLVLGGEDDLGNWDVKKTLSMHHVGNYEWQVCLDSSKYSFPLQFKCAIIDEKGGLVHWEDFGNRIIYQKSNTNMTVYQLSDYQYTNFNFKGAGVAIPVFSLRSEKSFGIGDFDDLRKMVDWAAMTGQQIIQLLPLNDTTNTFSWHDSYPYSAISSYALHPMYLGCSSFPLHDKELNKNFVEEAKSLNELPQLDYEKVLHLKMRYYKHLFEENFEEVSQSENYQKYYSKNEYWLFPYVCYCVLRDTYKTASYNQWGSLSVYNKENLKSWLHNDDAAKEKADFYAFLQYMLHIQLLGVKEYAHSKGIGLKGDIPIGINRDSVDAWTFSRLFNFDTQTGAPPDDFSVKGQNWGFPTYNWREMEADNFAWWKTRFRKMADYFDAYRIDHILGFFRIWEIPTTASDGFLGHFSPALPYYADEIRQAGIPFTEERMVEPFIHENFLSDYFGEYTEEVKQLFLDVSGWQIFKLRSICDTQSKIWMLFSNAATEKEITIRDGLLNLCTEVLFVRDREDRNRFHPRITAQYTHSYAYLNDYAKQAFNRLYDDFFYHRHNYFWRGEAMRKLPELIASTRMLVCGEDLGMVPDCVPSVMHELKILSLEIQRMPKQPNWMFSDMMNVPYLCVCTTSTHDMAPIRLWWEENSAIIQEYYKSQLGKIGVAPAEADGAICENILKNHLLSNAMWVILPWQDWMSIDEDLRNPDAESERINIPANPNHYWRYRMHMPLEKLLKEKDLNKRIKKLAER